MNPYGISHLLNRTLKKTKIKPNLEPNKAHGYDIMNIHMSLICDESICKTLAITCKSCCEKKCFFPSGQK